MTEPEQRHGGTATRVVVLSIAVVAVLLLGAAVGLLIQLPGRDGTSVPAADSVDVGFAQDMAVHHLQGVTMANLARDKTADPAVRQLAFDIQSTQLEQVGRMKGWLTFWGYPEQSVDGRYMRWMSGSGHGHGGDPGSAGTTGPMPGMATSEELNRLRRLSGPEFDVYFLQLMLRHHQGGAPMARFGAENAGQPVVRTLADNMLRSQASESELMRTMITERGAAPLEG
ncbi:DUF305 domain-containing protein [Saccharothrix lopnurensis]|uniref:DUF305 domain-containing protein n=1 Tax=Saccharothrix lopnurensis TaxID=1670621 RepID=A0ABW1PD28_9PSEU